MDIKTNSHTNDQQQTSIDTTPNVARNETDVTSMTTVDRGNSKRRNNDAERGNFQIKNVKNEVIIVDHDNEMTTKDLKFKSCTVKSLPKNVKLCCKCFQKNKNKKN